MYYYRLVQLALTLPVVTATVERSIFCFGASYKLDELHDLKGAHVQWK